MLIYNLISFIALLLYNIKADYLILYILYIINLTLYKVNLLILSSFIALLLYNNKEAFLILSLNVEF